MNKRYLELSNLYKELSDGCNTLEEARLAFYEYESTGKEDTRFCSTPNIYQIEKEYNGFAVGKRNLDITVAMWLDRLTAVNQANTLCKEILKLEDRVFTDENIKEVMDRLGLTEYNNEKFKFCATGWASFLRELYYDPKYPHWWLDGVFKEFLDFKDETYKDSGKTSKQIMME